MVALTVAIENFSKTYGLRYIVKLFENFPYFEFEFK